MWKDATTIIFASDRDGDLRIYEQSIDGTSAAPLTNPPAGESHDFPTISGDGKLVYTTSSPGTMIMMKPFDGEPVPLVSHGNAQAGGSFSLDGGAFSYVGIANSASPRVYVVRYPPPLAPYPADAAGVPASPAESVAIWPEWLMSDTEGVQTLIYQDPALRTMSAVDVALPSIAFSNRRTIANISINSGDKSYAPIPGTNRFVVIMANDDRIAAAPSVARSVVVIRNFQELLRERVR